MIRQNKDMPKYDSKLDDVVERSGKYGPYLLWSFKDTQGNRWVGFTEAVLTFGNRLWTWLYCLGFYVQPGDSFDLSSLKGKDCLIIIGGKGSTVSAVVPLGNTAVTRDWTPPPPPEQTKPVEPEAPTPAKVQDEVERLFG